MNKTISVERLYSLGDYRNIKFIAEITEIPTHIALDAKATSLIWYLQLVEIEEARHKYDLLTRDIINTTHDEVAVMLEEERTNTYLELIAQLTKEKEVEEEQEDVID